MRKTSILIPIILIACLLALAYLITQAFRAAGDDAGGGNTRIILNEDDYADENNGRGDIDLGAATNTDDAEAESGQNRSDYQTVTDADANDFDDEEENDDATPPTPRTGTSGPIVDEPIISEPISSSAGRYLVIAGSFRQLDGGKRRVSSLRSAGFNDTRLARFNRGTYAVALAGQMNSYRRASELSRNIRAAGFEAEVLRRR